MTGREPNADTSFGKLSPSPGRFGGAGFAAYDTLRALPTDPGTLVTHLREKDPGWSPRITLTQIATQPLAPPKLRAATFRALAHQTRVTVVRDVVDLLGRHGVGLSVDDGGGWHWTGVFDAKTYVFLGLTAWNPAGLDHGRVDLAILDTGFVSRVGERP